MDTEETAVDLSETILSYRDTEEDNSFKGHVNETLDGHQLLATPSCKAWFIGKEKEWNYAFRVVWIPGNLHFSGDLDEVTFTHYQAMPTWKDAVDWVSRSDFHYLMEKSTANRKFEQLKSAVDLVRQAEEHLVEWDGTDYWEKIFEYLDGFHFPAGGFFDTDERDVRNPDDRKLAIDFMLKEAYTDFTPETVYNILECPDWTGCYEYNYAARWQYHGMRRWAALVKETEEYKRETEASCTKSSETS